MLCGITHCHAHVETNIILELHSSMIYLFIENVHSYTCEYGDIRVIYFLVPSFTLMNRKVKKIILVYFIK